MGFCSGPLAAFTQGRLSSVRGCSTWQGTPHYVMLPSLPCYVTSPLACVLLRVRLRHPHLHMLFTFLLSAATSRFYRSVVSLAGYGVACVISPPASALVGARAGAAIAIAAASSIDVTAIVVASTASVLTGLASQATLHLLLSAGRSVQHLGRALYARLNRSTLESKMADLHCVWETSLTPIDSEADENPFREGAQVATLACHCCVSRAGVYSYECRPIEHPAPSAPTLRRDELERWVLVS